MIIRNWLAQDIKVNSIVGRGARCGNKTEVKVGRVIDVDAEKRTVRVHWLLEPTYGWEREKGAHSWRDISAQNSKGSPNVDTLFLLDKWSFSGSVPVL